MSVLPSSTRRALIAHRSLTCRLGITGVLISSVSGSSALLPDAYQGDLCIPDSYLPGEVLPKSGGADFEMDGGL